MSKYSLLRYRKNPKVEPNWRTRGDTLKFFIHSVANQKKLKGEKKILKKSLTMPKKLKGGPFGEFFFEKKSHRAENTLREYPFVPLSFLDDVKILLRKLLKYFKFAK